MNRDFVHALLTMYAARHIRDGLTCQDIANRIGRSERWVSRRLLGLVRLKLEEVADLAAAMDGELELVVVEKGRRPA